MMMVTSNPRPRKLFAALFWITVSLLTLTLLLGPPSSTSKSRGASGRDILIQSVGTMTGALTEHPVKRLVREADVKFEAQIARQSKSFDEATSVYYQRYQRSPPPGFGLWYKYALRHHSLIVDDFDIINEYLAPFWGLSGVEVKSRLDNVRKTGPPICHCQSSNGQWSSGCACLGHGLLNLLKDTDISSSLPGFDILVNALDEPRVLPRSVGHRIAPHISLGNEIPDWIDSSHLPVWER